MSETEETKVELSYTCEFCNRAFVREKSFLAHTCEQKKRWLDRDLKPNRLGFQSWLQFYKKTSMGKKQRTYEDFMKSPYYLAFVKFGLYCSEVNVINVSRYVDWLLRDNIKLDTWNRDTNYNKFLQEYLRVEDPFDALARSVETCMEIAEETGIEHRDCFRYANKNKMCHAISTGKISPWAIYQCESGLEFLDNLTPDAVRIIFDYIQPEQWAIVFRRSPKEAQEIKAILASAGW